jgi:hypothetical protein
VPDRSSVPSLTVCLDSSALGVTATAAEQADAPSLDSSALSATATAAEQAEAPDRSTRRDSLRRSRATRESPAD